FYVCVHVPKLCAITSASTNAIFLEKKLSPVSLWTQRILVSRVCWQKLQERRALKKLRLYESTCITVPDLTVLLVAIVPFGDASTVAADWRKPTNPDG